MDLGGSDGIGHLQNQLGEMASSFVSPGVQGVSKQWTQFQSSVSKKSSLSFLNTLCFNDCLSVIANLLMWNVVKACLQEEKVVRQGARVSSGQVFRDALRDSWPGAV